MRKNLRFKLLSMLLLAAFSLPAAAGSCKLADLHWLKGSWHADTATAQSEERWTIAPGDRLMGSSWFVHTDTPGGVIEAETIQNDGDTVLLRIRHFSANLATAREEKDAPMVFLAVACEGSSVRFEGQGAQTGEKISYSRDGDKLRFSGRFSHQGEAVKVELSFVRAGD